MISALPLLLFLLGDRNWMFDSPDMLDSQTYLTYFRRFTEPISFFKTDYKSSRLPWILPGWICFKLWGPIAGNHILHLGVQIFSLVGLYLGVREFFGSKGLALSIAMGTSVFPLWHGLGGWNYHMGAAITYELWSIYFIALAREKKFYLFLAGFLFAFGIHTHLFLVAFVPLLWLYYRAFHSTGHSLRDVTRFAAGAIVSIPILSAINVANGGTALFFVSQITYTFSVLNSHDCYYPILHWLPSASYLLLPVVSSVLSITALFLRHYFQLDSMQRKIVDACAISHLCSMGIGVLFQSVVRVPIFQPDYCAGVFLCPALFALAAFCFAAFPAIRKSNERTLGVIAFLVFLVPVIGGSGLFPIAKMIRPLSIISWGWWTVGVVIGFHLLLFLRSTLWAPILAMGLCTAGIGETHRIWFHPRPLHPQAAYYRELYDLLNEMDEFLYAFDPHFEKIKIWFDDKETTDTNQAKEHLGRFLESLVFSRSWAAFLDHDNNRLAHLPTLPEEKIEGVGYIAILSASEHADDYRRRFAARAKQLGYVLFERAATQFRLEETKVTLLLLEPQKLSPPSN